MTVIAYRDGIMAADSCWSDDGLITTLSDKIIRLQSGGIVGEAGDCDTREMIALLTSATDPSGLPTCKELLEVGIDYHAILVLPDGSVWDVGCASEKKEAAIYRINRKFYAVGAGKRIAIGVLAKGGTAQEAVAIACEFETTCREPVQVVTL